jgi:thiosulfate reductase cytochrome b subunit
MAKVFMYSRFLRLWHWLQALLVITLLATGFEVHGTIKLLGYEQAASYHRLAAWTLLGLWVLAWFWHITTGEWKQYIPSPVDRIIAMMRYYGLGIFKGEPHPFHKDRWHRQNPLQRMAYLSVHVLIGPVIWISGLAYISYPYWSQYGLSGLSLAPVALLHTVGAFLMLAFLIVHLYLALSTSERPFGNLKEMITGYEETSEDTSP